MQASKHPRLVTAVVGLLSNVIPMVPAYFAALHLHGLLPLLLLTADQGPEAELAYRQEAKKVWVGVPAFVFAPLMRVCAICSNKDVKELCTLLDRRLSGASKPVQILQRVDRVTKMPLAWALWQRSMRYTRTETATTKTAKTRL